VCFIRGTGMLIIADRIDATRKHIAQAIAAKNPPFIQNEAKAQAVAGADYIGIKTGSMEMEEEVLMGCRGGARRNRSSSELRL